MFFQSIFTSSITKIFQLSPKCIEAAFEKNSIWIFKLEKSALQDSIRLGDSHQSPGDVKKWPLSFWTFIRNIFIEPQ